MVMDEEKRKRCRTEATEERCRYIDPMSDWGFKVLFGTEANKEFLLSLLRDLFPEERITDITYLREENQGLTEGDRKTVFDVACSSEDGRQFVVEVQKKNQKNFRDRSLYYSSFPIQMQGGRGEWDYSLTPVYMVGILNFAMNHSYPEGEPGRWSGKRVHRYELREEESGELMTGKLKFVFLEVGPFGKCEESLADAVDEWMYALKHMRRLTEKPERLREDVFGRLFAAAELAAFTPEERNQYEKDMMTENDYRNTIDYAREQGVIDGMKWGEERGLMKGRLEGRKEGEQKGLRKGREEGIREGRDEGLIIAAVGMKKMGLGTDVIAKVTGLDIRMIEGL